MMNIFMQRIANTIIANLGNTVGVGLFDGKMGLAIFFYKYAKYSKCQFYCDVANNLIDEVYAQISGETPSGMDGIAGIGIGISLLLKDGFLYGNPDDVLFEIDEYLFKSPELVLGDLDKSTHVFPLGLYLVSRLMLNNSSEIEDKWINIVLKVAHYIVLKDGTLVQLSFINSMLFVFAKVYEKKLDERDDMRQLINELLLLANNAIDNGRFTNIDLLLFRRIYKLFPEVIRLNVDRIRCYSFDFGEFSYSGSHIGSDCFWCALLYSFMSSEASFYGDVRFYMNENIDDYSCKSMTTNIELAVSGLGKMLMI